VARIGNFDVQYNPQGWFDTTLADPLNGWLCDDAIGLKEAVSAVGHGGWPATRARRPNDKNVIEIVLEEERERIAALGEFPWLDGAAENDTRLPSNVAVLDRFGPLESLPESDFLVAGNVEEQSPWKWVLIGAAVGAGIMLLSQKAPKSKGSRRAKRA
jgi:hypothetical protein